MEKFFAAVRNMFQVPDLRKRIFFTLGLLAIYRIGARSIKVAAPPAFSIFPLAIKKGIEAAKKNLIRVPLINNTLPHQLIGEFGAGRVLVKPASEGTGVIAGGAVRAVMQAVGVRDVRTKVLGSANPHNVVRATFDALLRMKDPMELARLRGKQVEEL